MGEPSGHGLEETWEKNLLEAPFATDMDLSLDFFGEFNSLVEPEGFPLQSVLLQGAQASGKGDESTTLSSGGEDVEGDAVMESDDISDSAAKKLLWKRNKREREKAVRSRKRKRAQMEALLQTTRQLQAQNAQLLRTLGVVQQMAEEKDMADVALMAASASSASLTELEATESLVQEAGAGTGTEGGKPSAFGVDEFDVKKGRDLLKIERMKVLQEGVRILNTGVREHVEAMCEAVHHPNVTLLNPDLSHETQGLTQLHKYWRCLSEAFPDFSLSIEDISADDEAGDKLKLLWKFKGTQVEPFLPVLPAGRFIELSGKAFISFQGLKIVRHIWSWNHTGLLLNLIGYETKDTDECLNSTAWESSTPVKTEPRSEQTAGSTDGEAPCGPQNMQTRIAETISSMVRSISAGNLALQQADSTTLGHKLKRAKSTADMHSIPSEQGMKRSSLKVTRTSPKPRPRTRGKPKYKRAPMQHMLGMPQPPYLIPNAHMLPGFPMTGASGIFVALPQNQVQITNSANQTMSPTGHSDGATYTH